MSKRMIFSDVHLHPWKYGATTLENGFNSRLWAQREALMRVYNDCVVEGIEYAYFCGDMFHTPGNVPTQALAVAQEFYEKMDNAGIKLRMLVGNHDMGNRNGNIHALAGRNAVPPGGIKTWQDGSLLVHGLGYTNDEAVLRRFLDYGAEYGGMLLMHQGVAGVPLSSGYILDEKLSHDLIPENCVAFTGHYHIHSPVSERLTVVGNLTALNWNDIDQNKGYIIYNDETGDLYWKSSFAPEFVTYDADVASYHNFVRYDQPVAACEVEAIRADILKDEAIAVEFTNIVDGAGKTIKGLNTQISSFNPTQYISELEGSMEPRRVEVGQQTREMNYE
jgi:DNA repair exonuclease SbcCD nuclease subunit